jgi:hypothetical protein
MNCIPYQPAAQGRGGCGEASRVYQEAEQSAEQVGGIRRTLGGQCAGLV